MRAVLGSLLIGTAVIETLFARPGLGRVLLNAVIAGDIPLIMGVIVFGAVLFVVINSLVDVLATAVEDEPTVRWTPEEVQASWAHMRQIYQDLVDAGELLGTEKLAGPSAAKVVRSDGGVPVVTDGPFPEAKEFLAGYWIVDVESTQRAYEIAARASSAPGPGGVPMNMPIEVRQVMSGPPPEFL